MQNEPHRGHWAICAWSLKSAYLAAASRACRGTRPSAGGAADGATAAAPGCSHQGWPPDAGLGGSGKRPSVGATRSASGAAPPGISAEAGPAEPGRPGRRSGGAAGSGRAGVGWSAECRDGRRRFDGGCSGVSASSSRPPARAPNATVATTREKTTAQSTDSRVSAAAARPPISAAAMNSTAHRWNPCSPSGAGGCFACSAGPVAAADPLAAAGRSSSGALSRDDVRSRYGSVRHRLRVRLLRHLGLRPGDRGRRRLGHGLADRDGRSRRRWPGVPGAAGPPHREHDRERSQLRHAECDDTLDAGAWPAMRSRAVRRGKWNRCPIRTGQDAGWLKTADAHLVFVSLIE